MQISILIISLIIFNIVDSRYTNAYANYKRAHRFKFIFMHNFVLPNIRYKPLAYELILQWHAIHKCKLNLIKINFDT